MRRRFLLAGAMFLSLAVGLFAQATGPTAILQYFDDPTQVTVTDASGKSVGAVTYGMALSPGDTITTQSSTAELQLQPNGSILKIAANTRFKIQTLQGSNGQQSNDFSLLAGRLRTIAARSAEGGDSYSFETPTAVCGVRGTDFTLEVSPGKTDAVGVLTGQVNFVDTQTGRAVTVQGGMFANTFAPVFQPVRMSGDEIDSLFTRMNFERLNPSSVPGHVEEVKAAQAEQEKVAETPPPKQPEEIPAPAPKPAPSGGFFAFLHDHLGMEIGSLTIDGTTYAMAAVEPQFAIGKLQLALYLPIIYQRNLFDSSDWYHPNGNDEWNFGFGASFGNNTWARVGDAVTDLMLKIRYLEWGKQRDPFYLKVGNLEDMTIGAGILMNDYANDEEFPAVRRIGLNFGIDGSGGGFEGVASDLSTVGNLIGGTPTTNPEIFGGRIYTRPIPGSKLAFGLSTIVDLNPASSLAAAGYSTEGDPAFITFGPDIEVPLVQTDPFAIIVFADAGGMIPYFRNPFNSSIGSGPYLQAVWYNNSLRNFGIASGLLGNVANFDWRLEFRYANGTFQNAMFNSTYDRTRSLMVAQLASYLNNEGNPQYLTTTMGVYGQGGIKLGTLASFQVGYFWPFSTSGFAFNNDSLHLALVLYRGIIPGFGLHGSLSFDRVDFVPTLLNNSGQSLTLFDANTTVKAELIYPIAPTLDIAMLITTAVVTSQATGQPTMDPSTGLPVVAPIVTIQARVHF